MGTRAKSYKSPFPFLYSLNTKNICKNIVCFHQVSLDSFLSKVLDDPTDWTARPYSPLEGGHLQARFQEDYETQAYNPPSFARQFGFDQGVSGPCLL